VQFRQFAAFVFQFQRGFGFAAFFGDDVGAFGIELFAWLRQVLVAELASFALSPRFGQPVVVQIVGG
jgi:hypothetical protein